MATIYVNPRKFKIFRKLPRYGKASGSTKHMKTFRYTTNNPKGLVGVVAKKGSAIRYDK